ncbi:MAG: HesA/MoeB/ThiF family protein [Legionellales bacterium]|jgi:adenylyltransferase/sulfurtransferase
MNDQQLLRYSRHIFLPEVDIQGQEKLLKSTVLILGLGGLGSPAALYLAASGVGRLILADRDKVELSNLQRQIIHTTESINQEKTISAAQTIKRLNPDIELILTDDVLNYIHEADCVIDGSDSFTTRFAINQACVTAKIPLISGAAIQFSGQLCVFDFKNQSSPCYQCLYPDLAADELRCQDSGVIAPLVGVIGSLQALEALKLLLGLTTSNHLLQFDALNMQFRKSEILADPHCTVCSSLLLRNQ